MTTDPEILSELKKTNELLTRLNKGPFNNFIAGFMHSFGYFTGTIAIFLILIFFASRYDWTKALSKSFEKFMSQINWTNVIPAPKLEFPGFTQNN